MTELEYRECLMKVWEEYYDKGGPNYLNRTFLKMACDHLARVFYD
jgi:hypothetical protein